MREDAYTTHQLHYQLQYSPFHGKDSASTASLHLFYAPMIAELAAAQHRKILNRQD